MAEGAQRLWWLSQNCGEGVITDLPHMAGRYFESAAVAFEIIRPGGMSNTERYRNGQRRPRRIFMKEAETSARHRLRKSKYRDVTVC